MDNQEVLSLLFALRDDFPLKQCSSHARAGLKSYADQCHKVSSKYSNSKDAIKHKNINIVLILHNLWYLFTVSAYYLITFISTKLQTWGARV